jgi:hypothetical protein
LGAGLKPNSFYFNGVGTHANPALLLDESTVL